jgi:hypothetical protein
LITTFGVSASSVFGSMSQTISLPRIFNTPSIEIFLSTAHRQSGVLTIDDDPDISMLDDYGIAKPLGIFGEVFFDPGVCALSEGKKQKQRTVIFRAEVGSI